MEGAAPRARLASVGPRPRNGLSHFPLPPVLRHCRTPAPWAACPRPGQDKFARAAARWLLPRSMPPSTGADAPVTVLSRSALPSPGGCALVFATRVTCHGGGGERASRTGLAWCRTSLSLSPEPTGGASAVAGTPPGTGGAPGSAPASDVSASGNAWRLMPGHHSLAGRAPVTVCRKRPQRSPPRNHLSGHGRPSGAPHRSVVCCTSWSFPYPVGRRSSRLSGAPRIEALARERPERSSGSYTRLRVGTATW